MSSGTSFCYNRSPSSGYARLAQQERHTGYVCRVGTMCIRFERIDDVLRGEGMLPISLVDNPGEEQATEAGKLQLRCAGCIQSKSAAT